MDYDKYYRVGSDGTYNIHFPNKKSLSIERIREIFSSYGKVLSINISGDINGLRFVRYKTLDEVIKCLDGLQNHDEIRILRQKDKINTNQRTDQRCSNQWQPTRMDNPSQRIFNANRQSDSSIDHNERSLTMREIQTHNKNSVDWNNKSDNIDNLSNSSGSRQSYKFNTNPTKYKRHHMGPMIPDRKHSLSPKQQNFVDNEISTDEQAARQQKNKSYSSIKSDANSYRDKDISIKNMPALISECERSPKEFNSTIFDNDKSLSAGTKNASSKMVVIPMQEVIVANIDANYGTNYILHLFEKHNPISATYVKTISETGIRYCHVYFKMIQDALAIEEKFDNFTLSGKNLIVLRKSRLIDMAMCK